MARSKTRSIPPQADHYIALMARYSYTPRLFFVRLREPGTGKDLLSREVFRSLPLPLPPRLQKKIDRAHIVAQVKRRTKGLTDEFPPSVGLPPVAASQNDPAGRLLPAWSNAHGNATAVAKVAALRLASSYPFAREYRKNGTKNTIKVAPSQPDGAGPWLKVEELPGCSVAEQFSGGRTAKSLLPTGPVGLKRYDTGFYEPALRFLVRNFSLVLCVAWAP